MSFHKTLIDRDLHAPSNEQVENNTASPFPQLRATTFDGFGTAFIQVKLGDGSVDLIAGITQTVIDNTAPLNVGFITALGILVDIDTSSFLVNDILFAGANGVLQTTPNGTPVAQVLVSDAIQGKIYVQIPHRTPGVADEKVKVSANDATTDYLDTKLTAGSGIQLIEQNDGGNETLEISAPGSTTDEQVKVSSNDTTPDFLDAKLTAGSGIQITEQNDGFNETLEISAPDSTTDEKVKVSSNDTTPGFLEEKIVVDTGTNTTNALESSEINDGGDEDLRIRFDETKVDHTNLQNIGTNSHADLDNHITDTTNPHDTTFTQSVTADPGTDITAAEAETLTDGSNADALHAHAANEANTASNVGTAGVGPFKQKTGIDLEFKNINAGSNKISVTDDVIDDEIDVDVNESNIIHQNLSGAGSNTHTDIDNHIADTANPHDTTFTEAVAADSGTDITAAEAETLTDGSNADALHAHAASLDEKAKVSSNDTTPGFLNGKLVAGTNITLVENNDGGDETLTIDTASSLGEANTASNVGAAGVGPFKQKTGIDLEFKNINAGSNKISITDDVGNDEIDVDVDESNIIHQNLSGAGTNTHTDIDTHIADVSNPHEVTFTQAVAEDSGTDITAAEAETLTDGSNADALHMHAASLDEKVKVSANDTTPGFLNGKLVSGTGIVLTELNDGGDEDLEISSTIKPGAVLTSLFASTANNVNNKFLESELVATSDVVPGLVPISETLTKLTFTNANLAPTGDVEIRVNTTVGVPATSVSLTTLTRSEIFSISLAVVAGDELNCKVINASGIGKPLVKLYA